MNLNFDQLTAEISRVPTLARAGFVKAVAAGSVKVSGLSSSVRIGDLADIEGCGLAEVIAVDNEEALLLPFDARQQPYVGRPAYVRKDIELRPSQAWIGRIVDSFGNPIDGAPIQNGELAVPLWSDPPLVRERRPLDTRIGTSLALLDTVLPIAKGQRLGIFAGSGVGKTSLISQMARNIEADVCVVCQVGERGRELNEFIKVGLGEEGLKRSIVVAATSDQSPLLKRRAALVAMATAEYFRDEGKHVLLLVDSLTRFADAHREIALLAGETPSLRAYPPSTANLIASLTERAGVGGARQGDITAVFSVLVAGSDMEEPVADITRGLLDGHVILDRDIAERGRFPAINIQRSVSRSLPGIASPLENAMIARVREILSVYDKALPMISSGLYQPGTDPAIDSAVKLTPLIDRFATLSDMPSVSDSFDALGEILDMAKQGGDLTLRESEA